MWRTVSAEGDERRSAIGARAHTQTLSDPLFDKTHRLTLTGLPAGQTYYIVVRGADRSGNQAVIGEYQVKVQIKTYLPRY